MPVTLEWQDIALRLILTVVAGTAIGLNRGAHGRPAGLRTTLLVCLAASVAMIQANLLLGTKGKPPQSLVMIDVLRLPLGILSGIGFIGAGAILKRGTLVKGLTTAATLWFVTVLGLCFGGGQNVLGLTALALGLVVLWGFKWLELRLTQDRRATLVVTVGPDGPGDREIRARVVTRGFEVSFAGLTYDAAKKRREIRCELRWRSRRNETQQERDFLEELSELPGIVRLKWRLQDQPSGSI